MGRPPLHPDQRRTALVKAAVRQDAKDKFVATCRAHGYQEAWAVREALADWIKKKEQQ
jgi:hypothetical protein